MRFGFVQALFLLCYISPTFSIPNLASLGCLDTGYLQSNGLFNRVQFGARASRSLLFSLCIIFWTVISFPAIPLQRLSHTSNLRGHWSCPPLSSLPTTYLPITMCALPRGSHHHIDARTSSYLSTPYAILQNL
ncbi:uncharacterized protein K460DRAFT_148998 [Cucurbitaria berberidis CBS 394.84]|uniref:Uncharacterized protein n=1 Tax=Cucurbitaria berberidis CBS 394.84 TaxID=1168544 RepID=A0A9P4GEC2_9PLEO|nr:uncharacterized protein K460DRAFT_148998 [Cucurbitaria berberidis CBS 394.84]KAF1843655.1 hypothetical protein K460DRAFT_148998 [Cucurbitaria berberidis CBS 394.84]